MLCVCAAASLLAPATAFAERVNYRATSGSPNVTFFSNGGLKLTGSCGTSPGGGDLAVIATTSVNNALIHLNGQRGGAGHASTFNNDLDSTDLVTAFTDDLNADDSAVGQIVYAKPGGTNVTVDWMSEEADGSVLGGKDCVFTGHARVLGSGDADRINLRSNNPVGQDDTFFSNGGLRLIQAGAASCADIGPTTEVSARTGVADAMIGEFVKYTNDADTVDNLSASTDPDFDPELADERPLTANGSSDQNASGHLVYARPLGRNVTADYAAEESPPDLFGDKNCVFVGSARRADPGSSHRVNFRTPGDEPLAKFFELGGLKLRASCLSGELVVEAKTDYDDAMVHVGHQQPATGNSYSEDDIFDTADAEQIFGPTAQFDSSAGGQIGYSRPGGVNVTVDWHAEEQNLPLGGTRACAFVGTAEKNAP